MKRLLLLSNSTQFGRGYLDHAIEAVRSHLSGCALLAFVPFALKDGASYVAKVRGRFASEGIDVVGVTGDSSGARAIEDADAVFVGGGNTFRLLHALQRGGLLEPIRDRVLSGAPYLGASAGTNIVAPTIRTTNDMPIVEPAGLDALGLVPFQINPHYVDADPSSRHMGETRETRLIEYLEENARPVVGLREGAWLVVEGERVIVGGERGARVFARGVDPYEVEPSAVLEL